MTHKKSDSPLRRRAANMVWTAAESYDFDPLFLFFYQDGTPDFYMNSITGYVYKWMDREIFFRLFDTTEGAEHQDMYDGIIWLCLESWIYKRESLQRPVLSELRLVHAEEFFARDKDSSMQQWLSRDSLTYMLQCARWRTVLKKSDGLLSEHDRRLFHALDFDGSLSSLEVFLKIQEVFKQYLPFSKRLRRLPDEIKARGIFSRLLPFRMERVELSPSAKGGSAMEESFKERRPSRVSDIRRRQNAAQIRAYMEECFGRPLYDDAETNRLEQLLCTDKHLLSRLYFTAGERLDSSPDRGLGRALGSEAPDAGSDGIWKEIRRQTARNEAHYQSRRLQYETSIKKLKEKIQNAMFVYTEPSRISGKAGLLNSSLVWRSVYLDDDTVFHVSTETNTPEFSVDLMLDASSSRMDCQELLASQAYVIAKSLKLLDIPVQVYSFQSLRGYTVMNRFSSYNEKKDCRRIFHYFSAGWNRDGLAVKAAGHLMSASPSPNRLLIILTDARPNDDEKIPPNAETGRYFSEDYSGEAAIKDTEAEVKELKRGGVRVIGILTKDDRKADTARRIFGDDFVCIRTIGDLSDAVGNLLQKQIRQFHETLPPG